MPNNFTNNGTSNSTSSLTTGFNYDPRVGNGPLPQGIQGTQNRAYTRAVQPNELVSHQLSALLDSNSRYIQQARQAGMQAAANRGLLNSSLAAGTSEASAIQAGAPIASADAAAYQAAAGQNVDVLNQQNLQAMQNAASNYAADVGYAGTSLQVSGQLQRQRENLAYEGEQHALDRSFTTARDYFNYHYDLGRIGAQSRANIQEYAAHTGIDSRAQRNLFLNTVMQYALDQPDIFTPEVVGGILNAYVPVYDDFSNDLDAYLSDFFDDVDVGG